MSDPTTTTNAAAPRPARPAEGGFTVIEVIVAMIILGVGVMALAGSSAMVTRMVGTGKTSTVAMQVASQKLEELRVWAASSAVPCAANGAGKFTSSTAAQTVQGVSLTWSVPATGSERLVRVMVGYNTARGPRADTLRTLVLCG